jgi:hypothetical protein
VIAAALAAALVALSAASGAPPLPRPGGERGAVRGTEAADPEHASTARRAPPRDDDAELLEHLELLERLEVLKHLELFDE